MTAQRSAVVAAHLKGLRHSEIATHLGISYQAVCREIGSARRAKLLPARKPADPFTQLAGQLKTLSLRKGHLGDGLLELTPEERSWVTEVMLRDGYETVTEYVIDLVRAAYDTETAEKKLTDKPIETIVTTVVRPDSLQVYVDSTVVAAIPRNQYLTLARKLLDAMDMPFMVANTGLGPQAFAEARQLERRMKETTNPTKENDQ